MKEKRAKEIIKQFSGKKILVVGDVVLDHYIFGNIERMNPEAPVPILHAKEEKFMTGGAGNTAKNAAQLGAETILVSVVGIDDAAKRVADGANLEGYTLDVVEDDSRPTIEKNRYIFGSQQLLRVDYEEVSDIEGEVEKRVISSIKKHASEVDAIIVSDYAKGVVTEKVAEVVMDVSKEHDVPVMADVKPSRITYFTGSAYIAPNLKEAHEYLGLNQHENGGKDWGALADMLRESFDTAVFLTLSQHGIYVLGEDTPDGEHVPTAYVHADDVLDTSGCGDTSAVVISLAKLVGASDVESADIANAAGATVAKKIGSVGLTQEELLHTFVHESE